MFSLKSAFEDAQAASHGLSPLAVMFWMVAIDEDRQQREREKKRRRKQQVQTIRGNATKELCLARKRPRCARSPG